MYYSELFKPLKIGNMEIRNRTFYSAMGTNFTEPKKFDFLQKAYDYYAARARGGYGLIVVENTTVQPSGAWSDAGFQIGDDRFVPQFKKLADVIHSYGAKAVVEIAHIGRSTNESCNGGRQPISASPVPDYLQDNVVKGVTIEEIEEIKRDMVAGARRVKEAGFDGVELHCAHGYLMASFLSGRTNKRMDKYGGTLEGRLRLLLEVIDEIRMECGREFPILVRLSSFEINGGRTVEETRVIAKALEKAGIDAIDISAGSTCEKEWIVPPAYLGYANNMENIEKIKSAVSIPVLASGRITEPRIANQLLEEGRCDVVGLNRAGIADPDFVRKAGAGQTEEIRRCIGCSRCINSLSGVDPLRCTVNPYVGREGEIDLSPVETPRKVLIVGAGPTGIECANLAATKGHDVTVVEKNNLPGGQLKSAAVPPHKYELAGLISVGMNVAEKLGVKFIFNQEVDEKFIKDFEAEAIIVATGAKPFVPKIEGIDGPNVVAAIDLLEGKVHAGDKVVILGGGIIGCETAEFLAQYAKKHITIVEMLPTIGAEICPHFVDHTFDLFKRREVDLKVNSKVTFIGENSVTYVNNEGESTIEDVETIVVALGTRADNQLYGEISSGKIPTYLVGDAIKSGQLTDALDKCYDVVNAIK